MDWIVVKTLLSLVVVLAVMVAVVYVLKRFVYQGGSGSASLVPVELLGQRSLQPKRSIMVVKVLQSIIVVGVSEQGMTTLATLDDEESLAEIARRQELTSPAHHSAAGVDFPLPFAVTLQNAVHHFMTQKPGSSATSKPDGGQVKGRKLGRNR